jgi:glutamate carboxypeptidase
VIQLELLRELVEIESPTGDTREMRDRMRAELVALGATLLDAGEHVRADFPGEGSPLLLLGHIDTVWRRGTLASMPWRVVGNSAETPRALRVVLTADEEMGSRTALGLLREAAEGAAAAFVVEPPTARGDLKTARKGLGRFELSVTGRSGHAGVIGDGASAIDELARQILRLHGLTDRERGVSVNVGVIEGGTQENVVAAHARAEVDVRVWTEADLEWMEQVLYGLRPETPGTSLEWGGGWTRPPLERTPGSTILFEHARAHGLDLGLDLKEAAAGGGSDGNLVGALGLPVLDGLGAQGSGAHSPDECVRIDSLPVRAELLARLLRSSGL